MAHAVLAPMRLTAPRHRLVDKHGSVQHQGAGTASPASLWEEVKEKQRLFFPLKKESNKTTSKPALSTLEQGSKLAFYRDLFVWAESVLARGQACRAPPAPEQRLARQEDHHPS